MKPKRAAAVFAAVLVACLVVSPAIGTTNPGVRRDTDPAGGSSPSALGKTRDARQAAQR